MFRALITNNKISFINGSIKSPLETKNPIEYALNQCNNMILSWISLSIEPDQAKSVVHAKIAHQVWTNFKDLFSQKNAPTIYKT